MQSITFNDLLTDPKYREMSLQDLTGIIVTPYICSTELITEGRKYFNLKEGQIFSEVLFNHLQKLKAESENMVFKDYEKVFDMFFKPINKPVTFTPTKPEPSIQITDQKAREICAKYFNCPPNEIKIV